MNQKCINNISDNKLIFMNNESKLRFIKNNNDLFDNDIIIYIDKTTSIKEKIFYNDIKIYKNDKVFYACIFYNENNTDKFVSQIILSTIKRYFESNELSNIYKSNLIIIYKLIYLLVSEYHVIDKKILYDLTLSFIKNYNKKRRRLKLINHNYNIDNFKLKTILYSYNDYPNIQIYTDNKTDYILLV